MERQTKHCAKSVLIPEISINTNTYIGKVEIPKDVFIQKYCSEGLSLREIATQFSSSKTTVRDQIIKHGIELRNRGGNEFFKDRFGKRRKRYKTRKSLEEHKIINIMIDMRRRGLSYRKIAELLTDMKVPTKTGKKKWHNNVVREILNRFESLF